MRMKGLVLVCLLGVSPLAAQSAPIRASLDAFSDSLQILATVDQIRAVERRASEQSQAARDATSAMRLGLTLLQRAQAEDGRFFDRARKTFRQAHDLEPEWVYPLLAIGLAERGKGDWLSEEGLNIGTRVGHGAYRSAVRALIEATARDPSLTTAVIEMDRVATSLRDTTIDHQVLAAVRAAVAAGNDHPAALLILGRRERSAGESEASIASLRRSLANGTDSSRTRFEIARTLLTGGSEEGEPLYFAAARSDDSVTIAELRTDLVPIAEGEELVLFDSARGGERERFLRRFWEDRARRDLRSPGERLREHYRRLRYARQQFVLSNNRRYYGFRDLYRAPTGESLDDRGVVYVRHGEPARRVIPLLFGLLPSETWLYRRPDGDLLLHFSGGGWKYEGGDLTDYRLVPSATALRGERIPMDMLFLKLSEVSDIYLKLMSWGGNAAERLLHEETEWGTASAGIGTTTDGFVLQFADSLDVDTDLVSIGRQGTTSLLQLVYALPATIAPGSAVRLRLSVFDSLGRIQAWIDSSAASEPMDGGGSGGRFELAVPPGQWLYRYAIEVGQAGVVAPLDSLIVPDLSAPALSVSGIGLGRNDSHVKWVASPADTALLSPGREFEMDSELQLYFEIYGLEAGAPYTASVLVRDRRGQRIGRSRLRFSFMEEGQGDLTRLRRGIRLTGLDRGEYWLEVAIRDGGRGEVVTRKWFSVISVAQ